MGESFGGSMFDVRGWVAYRWLIGLIKLIGVGSPKGEEVWRFDVRGWGHSQVVEWLIELIKLIGLGVLNVQEVQKVLSFGF